MMRNCSSPRGHIEHVAARTWRNPMAVTQRYDVLYVVLELQCVCDRSMRLYTWGSLSRRFRMIVPNAVCLYRHRCKIPHSPFHAY